MDPASRLYGRKLLADGTRVRDVSDRFVSADVLYIRFSDGYNIERVVKIESTGDYQWPKQTYFFQNGKLKVRREREKKERVVDLTSLDDGLLVALLKGENERRALQANLNGQRICVVDFC